MRISRPRHMVAVWIGLLVCLLPFLVVAASFSRSDPTQATYIDNQVHSIGANSDLWFKFDYGLYGPIRTLVTLSLANGAQSGVRFEVWAPENVGEWWQKQPTGRGVVTTLDCSTGQPSAIGLCQTDDVIWSGAFGAVGTYYVHVFNDNASAVNYLLVVQGQGVSLGPLTISAPTATPTLPAPTVAPLAFIPGVSPVAADDPTRAVWLDGQPWTIPAKSVIWYKFQYGGRDLVPRQQLFMRLVNGVVTGLRFELWSQQTLNNWWENKPFGQGTIEILTNCVVPRDPAPTQAEGQPEPTDEPQTGHCPTNDLTWLGALGGNGTYYIRLINDTNAPADYLLTIQ